MCWRRKTVMPMRLRRGRRRWRSNRPTLRGSKLGGVLMSAGELAAAEAAIQEAITLAPDIAGFHIDLSHALSRAGRMGEALDAARRGVAGEPANARFLGHLGDLLALAGELHEAEQTLRAAVRLDPQDSHIQGQLERILARLQQAEGVAATSAEIIPPEAGPQHLAATPSRGSMAESQPQRQAAPV
jgi:Flp pilus assembly protein TadD